MIIIITLNSRERGRNGFREWKWHNAVLQTDRKGPKISRWILKTPSLEGVQQFHIHTKIEFETTRKEIKYFPGCATWIVVYILQSNNNNYGIIISEKKPSKRKRADPKPSICCSKTGFKNRQWSVGHSALSRAQPANPRCFLRGSILWRRRGAGG